MSAGICILNKNAVAMAADSAVTIGDHAAIHNSANKLFSLSKKYPIGAIVYANSSFMQIPIETILKEFKKVNGDCYYSYLNDYLTKFIEFLENEYELFRFQLNENSFVISTILSLFQGLNNDHNNFLRAKIELKKNNLTLKETEEIAQQSLDITIEYVNSLPNSIVDNSSYVQNTYGNDVKQIIDHDFVWLDLDQKKTLLDCTIKLFSKFYDRSFVGLAITGYGKKDIFPHLVHAHFYGYLNGKISYRIIEKVDIDEQNNGAIVPLAQTDVMQTFLFGINDGILTEMATEISSQIETNINDLTVPPESKESIKTKFSSISDIVVKHIAQKAGDDFLKPIINSVSTLPIDELSLLAESMINITSLRRKVALDRNIGTVGGPIDVAIASKGDGFIWIKRKHYFDSKYNPQYFYSHFNTNKGIDDNGN